MSSRAPQSGQARRTQAKTAARRAAQWLMSWAFFDRRSQRAAMAPPASGAQGPSGTVDDTHLAPSALQVSLARPAPAVPSPSRDAPRAAATGARWLQTAEAGSVLGIRVLVLLATFTGRPIARLLLPPIALYYAAMHWRVRRASRAFLGRALGRPARFAEVVRHVHTFAQVTLDRLFILRGRFEHFQLSRSGTENIQELLDRGQGAVLLSAHLGSMSASRALDAERRARIYVAGYFRNAAMINHALGQLDPNSRSKVVHIDPGSPGSVLALRELVEQGNLVALAADRVGLGDRVVRVPFLGTDASFPLGPFILAAILRKPLLLVFSFFEPPNRYHFHCEPFAAGDGLPRRGRDAALRDQAARYAERLEHHARRWPYNWFNFFDFWEAPAQSSGPAHAPSPAPLDATSTPSGGFHEP